jgi:5'-nucleotidase
MTQDTIISNLAQLESTKSAIGIGGVEKFHVLSDFDRTLTKTFVAGEEVPSIISVLRSEGYLTPDYPDKAKELFNHYHAIEIDPQVPPEEKKLAMREWWSRHFDLLISSGLKKEDIEKAVTSQKLQLRSGVPQFFEFLRERNIPLVIMSSSGLGVESISLYLSRLNLFTDNVHIVSNEFIWDDVGRAIAVKEPIIHAFNKEETVLDNFPFYNKVRERKNVLLLGDGPDDVEMITGFIYDNLIKVGFLNKNIEENLQLYREKFDATITGDGNFDFINELLIELFQ